MAPEDKSATAVPARSLRFIVASNPEQFRDRSILTSNRSHIVRNHLRQKQSIEDSKARKRKAPLTPSSTTGGKNRSFPSRDAIPPEQVMNPVDALSSYRHIPETKSRSITQNCLLPSARSSGAPEDATISSLLRCRTEMYIPILNELYAARASLRDGQHYDVTAQDFDPYPEISVDILRFCCLRTLQSGDSVFRFASEGGPRGRLALMGSLSLASPVGAADGSHEVNADATEHLQNGFQDNEVTYLDSTCCAITFLELRATLSLDYDLARVHDNGLLRIMDLRGGLYELCAQLARAILCVVHFRAFAVGESLASSWTVYRDSIDRSPERDKPSSPYSPLLFPTNMPHDFLKPFTCSNDTLLVLHTACGLTSLAQELAALLGSAADQTSTPSENLARSTRIETLKDAIEELNFSVARTPRAQESDDYVHQACQAALQIYATATHRRIALPQLLVAATFPQADISPMQDLLFALRQTDISNCWGDLSGMLLWVSLIGGGAAQDASVKLWLFDIAIRCCSVLLVDNGDALVESFKTLSQVASLWGGDTAGL